MSEVSQILEQIEAGEPDAVLNLFPVVYDELRRMAAAQMIQEKPGHSLQATALVHEASLRLVGSEGDRSFNNSRRHFFGAAAEAMRRILIDKSRHHAREKHGGHLARIDMIDITAPLADNDLLALDEALQRLEAHDPIAAEVVKLKFFGGFSRETIAQMLAISAHEARTKWAIARA